MVLKLYGSAMSFARVLVTILEKDLPYEHILIDIAKGDQKSEAYKKLQPFGKVPALDDDGFVIFESRAICKYLARQVFLQACFVLVLVKDGKVTKSGDSVLLMFLVLGSTLLGRN